MRLIYGEGSGSAKIAVVGAYPGKYEQETGRPFSGPAGHLLDNCLESAGLRRSDIYLTNVYKYPLGVNEYVVDHKSFDYLWNELINLNPRVVVALGNIPSKVLCNETVIQNIRGSVYQAHRGGFKVIPTYNPAAILYMAENEGKSAYWQKHLITHDFKKAIRLSDNREWKPPYRYLHSAKNSVDVIDFFERNAKHDKASADIETFKCIPSCISFAFNSGEAISIPLFKCLGGLAITAMSYSELVICWRYVDKALRSLKIIGQNFKFDHNRLNSIGFEVPNFYFDTMLAAHCIDPELPKSQAFLASILTDENYYKEEGKGFDPKKDSTERLLLYNAKDSAVDFEIYECQLKLLEKDHLTEFYFDFVHHLHDLYMHIEDVGFRIHDDRRKELQERYSARLEENLKELYELSGYELNPNSPKQVKNYLESGLGFKFTADTSEETLVALLGRCKNNLQRRSIQLILDVRRINKTLSTYLTAELDYDGRIRTSYRITGTETGRTSTAILKPPLRHEPMGMAFQTVTKHGDIGKEIREIFIPDDGMIFLECDLSQAEARIVALLSDDYDTLKLFDEIDIHARTASWIFNKPDHLINPETERFIGKTSRHGGNYDMKKRRFMIEVNTAAKKFDIPLTISEWRAGQILEIFHKFTPKIREVFHRSIKEVVTTTRKLVSPNGRTRTFYERYGDDLFREAYAQIPQSTVTDHTKDSALILREELKNDMRIHYESHDSLFMSVPYDGHQEIARIIKSKFERPIDFADCSLSRGLITIPAEIKIGPNARDMQKLKL